MNKRVLILSSAYMCLDTYIPGLPSGTKETEYNLTFSWWLKVNFGIPRFTLGPLPSMTFEMQSNVSSNTDDSILL